MSISKLISIKNPIIDAMSLCNIDHDKYIPWFTRLATIAEDEIGSYYQYVVKHAVIDVNGCVACLPNDAIRVQLAIVGDLNPDCGDLTQRFCGGLNAVNNYGTVQNTFFVIDVGIDGGLPIYTYLNYQVQNNKVILSSSNYDGQKLTVQYLGYETDCDGFYNVSQNHVQAIKWYIIWMYYFRKPSMNSMEYGKMNKAEQEWHRECRHARALDSEIDEATRAKILSVYHDPYVGWGLSLGMNTTLGNRYSIW